MNRADFRLSIEGVDFTDKARPRLKSLSLTQKRGGEADQLEIVLDDTDGKLTLPPKNRLITLQLGWKQGSDVKPGLVDKGRFTVDEVSWGGPPDEVTIRARSADLTGAFRTRREKSHNDTTLGAIAKKIAAANGLEARVAPELASIAVPILTQHNQSDMAFLRRLGREHDAVATVKDRKLILSPIGKGVSATGKPLPGITLTRASGDSYRYAEIDRSSAAGVEARWHDVDAGERKTVKVTVPDEGEDQGPLGGEEDQGALGGEEDQGELGGEDQGALGGEDDQGVLGGEEDQGPLDGEEDTTRAPMRLRKVYHSEAQAKAAAKAEARRKKRAAAEFSMKLALGDATLAPETVVRVQGFKPRANARQWIVAEVTHRLDGSSGFTTDVKLETKA